MGNYREYKLPDKRKAAEMLAVVVREETGVSIEPKDIMSMFANRWQRLSCLAHEIHNGMEFERAVRQQAKL